MRIDLSRIEIRARAPIHHRREIVKVNIAHFNHRYVLLGYKDGKVEIRYDSDLNDVLYTHEFPMNGGSTKVKFSGDKCCELHYKKSKGEDKGHHG
jgi:hypothetical protein